MDCKVKYLLLLFSISTFFQNVSSLLDAELIVAYTKQKNLQMIIVYSCFVSKRGMLEI